ncbi:MAG: hypothetical protein HUJ26_07095 [Planctomycetaceae bacterium]|nr:hypothetical protein [Planctomycetaceae bacterium]
MDSVRNILTPILTHWKNAPLLHRALAGAAAAIVLMGLLLLGAKPGQTHYVPLSLGKQFSLEDLTRIETSLREQQLTSFKRDGQQILVPEAEQTAYDAALLKENQLPRDWASEWETKYEQTNPFTSSRKLQMLKEIALAKELKRIIQGLDGIAEANVVWAETETKTWPARGRKVTASVNIRPEPGQKLADQTIRAIQFSVANMVPNLEPQDVVVLDYAAGRHYQMHPEQARFETDLDQWVDRELSRWQTTLLPALQHHWSEATLQVQLQTEAFRQTAWQLAQAQTDATQQQNVPQLLPVERELRHRFPEFLSLKIDLPHGTEPTDEMPLKEEIHAALLGWLPSSFQSRQLEVHVPEHQHVTEVAPTEPESPAMKSWQPVLMVGLVGALLFVVSRQLRSEKPESRGPRVDASEEERLPDVEQPTEPPESSPAKTNAAPLNPLGDPELVAGVLKQWLGQSQQATNHQDEE